MSRQLIHPLFDVPVRFQITPLSQEKFLHRQFQAKDNDTLAPSLLLQSQAWSVMGTVCRSHFLGEFLANIVRGQLPKNKDRRCLSEISYKIHVSSPPQ